MTLVDQPQSAAHPPKPAPAGVDQDPPNQPKARVHRLDLLAEGVNGCPMMSCGDAAGRLLLLVDEGEITEVGARALELLLNAGGTTPTTPLATLTARDAGGRIYTLGFRNGAEAARRITCEEIAVDLIEERKRCADGSPQAAAFQQAIATVQAYTP